MRVCLFVVMLCIARSLILTRSITFIISRQSLGLRMRIEVDGLCQE